MVDFLKSYPFVSMEQYKWELSIPMIRIMSMDYTWVNYLDDDEIKAKNDIMVDMTDNDSLSDLGIPIFNEINN